GHARKARPPSRKRRGERATGRYHAIQREQRGSADGAGAHGGDTKTDSRVGNCCEGAADRLLSASRPGTTPHWRTGWPPTTPSSSAPMVRTRHWPPRNAQRGSRSEEHTSELQSREN